MARNMTQRMEKAPIENQPKIVACPMGVPCLKCKTNNPCAKHCDVRCAAVHGCTMPEVN